MVVAVGSILVDGGRKITAGTLAFLSQADRSNRFYLIDLAQINL
jgi:hypothetical protein